jgi:hypothetical protein
MRNLGRVFSTSALVLSLVWLTACGGSSTSGVTGSGVMKTEIIPVSGFSSINLTGSGKVIIEQTGTESLTIDAEDNILPLLDNTVTNKQLVLGSKPNTSFTTTKDIVYHVTVIDLGQIIVSGSGDASATAISTGMFNVELGGSGNISIDKLTVGSQAVFKIGGSGTVKIGELQAQNVSVNVAGSGSVSVAGGAAPNQLVSIGGSGSYQAEGLKSDAVQINVSGTGSATVYADKTLDVLISGSGTVLYLGNAAVSPTITGSGSVNKKS